MKNGAHKSRWCCDPSPTVKRAELHFSTETCLTQKTALCHLVSLMLRLCLSGGLKIQPSVINDEAEETKLKQKLKKGEREAENRLFNQIQSTLCALVFMEFNFEPSGHTRFSQSMKVHNDSEMSAESQEAAFCLAFL